MPRTIFLIIVDTLRFDVIADETLRRKAAPTLDQLVAEGSFGRIVANASNTQFVMPTLLTGTYPLDCGGYNTGCKYRPAGFPELFRAAGFETSVYSNCLLYNRDLGFDAGFDTVLSPVNSRRSLTQDIEYRVLPFLKRWQKGDVTDAEAATFIKNDYRGILEHLRYSCDGGARVPREIPTLIHRDRELARRCRDEIALIESDPIAIAHRLLETPEAFYWTVLGRRRAEYRQFAARLLNRAWDTWSGITCPNYPAGLFDAYDVLTDEALPAIERQLFHREPAQDRLIVLHVMDVHTPRLLENQWRRNPELVRAREADRLQFAADHGQPTAVYLGALSSVDRIIGTLISKLKGSAAWDDTALFITSDHGTTIPDIDGMTVPDLTNRFEVQDLTVPVIAVGGLAPRLRGVDDLFDSRDLGTTLLATAGLADAESFGGIPMHGPAGRDAVVSENGGRGRLDLDRDELNFAVTGRDSRLLARLSKSELSVVKRWNPPADVNQSDNALLSVLWRERGEILRARGAVQTTS